MFAGKGKRQAATVGPVRTQSRNFLTARNATKLLCYLLRVLVGQLDSNQHLQYPKLISQFPGSVRSCRHAANKPFIY